MDLFEAQLEDLKASLYVVDEGNNDDEHQRVSIGWSALDSTILDKDAIEVLDSLVVELYADDNKLLATNKLVLNKAVYENENKGIQYFDGKVKEASPSAFYYWGFDRTPKDYETSWERSAYKDDNAAKSNQNYNINVTKPGYALVKIKTVSGKEVEITTRQ